MFDPTIGRWISEDPIGFEAADTNLYRYVGNNPTNALDPSGKVIFWVIQYEWIRTGANPITLTGEAALGWFDGQRMVWNHATGRWIPALDSAVQRSIRDNGGGYAFADYSASVGVEALYWAVSAGIANEARTVIGVGGTLSTANRITTQIPATTHGALRLADASRLSSAEITAARLGHVLRQADGAIVYVHQAEPGKFNVVVEGTRGIITTVRHMSPEALRRMAINYAWRAP